MSYNRVNIIYNLITALAVQVMIPIIILAIFSWYYGQHKMCPPPPQAILENFCL